MLEMLERGKLEVGSPFSHVLLIPLFDSRQRRQLNQLMLHKKLGILVVSILSLLRFKDIWYCMICKKATVRGARRVPCQTLQRGRKSLGREREETIYESLGREREETCV